VIISSKSLFKNITFLYLGKIIGGIFNVILFIYLSHILLKNDFGLLGIFISISLYVTFLSGLGIAPTYLRYVPEYIKDKRFVAAKNILILGIFIRIFAGLFFIGIIYFFLPWFASKNNIPEILNYAYLIGILSILSGVRLIFDCYFSAIHRQDLVAVASSISLILRLLSIVGITFFVLMDYDNWLAVIFISFIMSELLACMAQIFWFNLWWRKRPAESDGDGLKYIEYRRLLRFAVSCYPATITGYAIDGATDIPFLVIICGKEFVPAYFFAFDLANKFVRALPIEGLITAMTPAIVQQSVDRDGEARYFNIYFKIVLIGISLPLIIVFSNAATIIEYINKNYVEAAIFFKLWLIFNSVRVLLQPAKTFLMKFEAMNVLLLSQIVAIIFMLTGYFTLGYILGPYGILISSGISWIIVFLITHIWLARYFNVSTSVSALFKMVIITAISISAGSIMLWFTGESIGAGILIIMLQAIIFFLGVRQLKYLDDKEFSVILNAFPNRLSKNFLLILE